MGPLVRYLDKTAAGGGSVPAMVAQSLSCIAACGFIAAILAADPDGATMRAVQRLLQTGQACDADQERCLLELLARLATGL